MSSGIRFVGQPDGGEGRGPHEMDVIAPNMEVSGDAGGYATCGSRISENGSCCLHRGTFASQRRNAVFYEHRDEEELWLPCCWWRGPQKVDSLLCYGVRHQKKKRRNPYLAECDS